MSPPNSCGAAFVRFGGPVAPDSIQGFHTSLTHFSLPGFLLTGHKLSGGRGRWRSDSQKKKKKKKDQSGPDSESVSMLILLGSGARGGHTAVDAIRYFNECYSGAVHVAAV